MEILFPILIAATVGLLAWSIIRLLTGNGTSRRMTQRLSEDGKNYQSFDKQRSILIQGTEDTALSKALARKNFFQKVQKQLSVVWPSVSLAKLFMGASIAGVLVLVTLLPFLPSPVVAFGAALVVWYMPFFHLSGKYNGRIRMLGEQLPEAMDFLSRILRSGHSLTTGLSMMGSELPEPLASEFRKCYDQHSLGQPMDTCLKDMADRVESTEFAFFVTAVLIQRQTGGDLSMVLGNISGTVRQRIRLAGFVKAKTAEGRLTGYILVAFPILMFFLASSMNPDYGNKLLHEPMGQKLLGTAITLQILGLVTIKKITTVKV